MNMRIGIQKPLEQYKNNWKTILSSELPKNLFHYSDLSGITGILETRQLWLSKVQYMNDYSEVEFFIKRLFYIIEHLPKFGISNEVLEKVKQIINEIRKDFYLASFCENGDLLSQWRGYSNDYVGVSIGLNSETLMNHAKKTNLKLIRCIYDESIQDNIAISIILDLVDNIEIMDNRLKEDYINYLSIAALTCKHPSFSEEKEWRLILVDSMKKDISVRQSNNQLIPYYKFNFPVWSQSGIIDMCYIGPNGKFNNIEEGLRMLISKNINHSFSISESSIPFR